MAQIVSFDPNGKADGGLGALWTTQTTTSAPQIAGNVIVGNGGDSAAAFTDASWGTPGADYYAEWTAHSIGAGDNGGPMVRALTAAETAYQFNIVGALGTSQTHTIYQISGGGYTPLGTWVGVVNNNDVVRLEVSGSSPVTLVAKVNGTTVITATDTTGSPITAANKPGLLVSGVVGMGWGLWAAGTPSAGGPTVAQQIAAMVQEASGTEIGRVDA